MSGPSIRNWELAGVLASRHGVTLAAPGVPTRSSGRFAVRGYTDRTLSELVRAHDVVIALGHLVGLQPGLWHARYLAVDLYDPSVLESLHLHEHSSLPDRRTIIADVVNVLTCAVRVGDVFLCASERQRDFWMGWIAAAGRINPDVHQQDRSLTQLLRVVPFGLPEEPPTPGPPLLRGVVPGIEPGDFVVLWGGGIWNWFDPLTLIRAAALLRDRLPALRVVFPAVQSPSPVVPPMRMAAEAVRLAEDLGLVGSHVFFGTGWVPYERRGQLLLEANVGVSLHQDDVETRYSFRTRVLDYLWAGLPIVTTTGDSLAELVAAEQLGAVIPYGDHQAVAEALLQLAEDDEWRRSCSQRARAAAQRFTWPQVAQPLLDYCDAPERAPDREWLTASKLGGSMGIRSSGVMARTIRAYHEGGLGHVVRKAADRVRRRLLPGV